MAVRVSLPRLVLVAAAILVAATFSLSPLGATEAQPVSPPVDQQVTEVQEVGASIAAWVQHEEAEAVGRLIAADAAEAQRQAELEAQRQAAAAQQQRAAQRPSQATAPSASTGACGGATNGADRYIGRESGGNPAIANASGAYGCYQIMPGTWAASCSDLGGELGSSASAQAQCASRLPLSAWAMG